MLYSIKQFIKHGVHLGHYKWESDYRLYYYILGIRNSIHIINIYYTLFVLKQVLCIAYNMCLIGQKIVIANDVGNGKLKSNIEKLTLKQLTYINDKWIGGLLSNQREIFYRNEKLYLLYYGFGYDALLPSYVLGSNVTDIGGCALEGVALSIPTSNLMDTTLGFYGIPYGIPSNDDSFTSIYFFTKLVIRMCFKSMLDNINLLKVKVKKKIHLKYPFRRLWLKKSLFKKYRLKKTKKKIFFKVRRNHFRYIINYMQWKKKLWKKKNNKIKIINYYER